MTALIRPARLLALLPILAVVLVAALAVAAGPTGAAGPAPPAGDPAVRLTPPASGPIPVAFVVSDGITVIDFTGPWEVFQDVDVEGRDRAFELYTVGPSRQPVRASAGLDVVPDHTFDDAPQPRVIVVGAQRGSPELVGWLRRASKGADLTMSVCTGAFWLGRAGLLDGRTATTHHDFFDRFESSFPKVAVRRDVRWVDGPRVATAGGLTSGIDLALRVVARYFGEDTAERTAVYMEYTSRDWRAGSGLWDPTVVPAAVE
jgi:transcriptional regulator GlxA family with amidase domain